ACPASSEGVPMRPFHILFVSGALAAIVAATSSAPAAQVGPGSPSATTTSTGKPKPVYSPYVSRDFPTRVFFGGTHLHTALSLDARAFGNTLGPEQAYRFARGEVVNSSTGQPVRLSRPLDFLAVSDHAEALGLMQEVVKGNPILMADPQVKRWHDALIVGGEA